MHQKCKWIYVFLFFIPVMPIYGQSIVEEIEKLFEQAHFSMDTLDGVSSNQFIDTAQKKLSSIPNPPENLKIELLFLQGRQLCTYQNSIKDGQQLYQEAIEAYQKLDEQYLEELGTCYLALARSRLGKNNEKGINEARQALQIFQKYGNTDHWKIADAMMGVSSFHAQAGTYDSMRYYLSRSITLHENAAQKNLIKHGHALNAMGWYYEDEGDLYQALRFQKKAQQAYLQVVSESNSMNSNIDLAIGNIYIYFENYELASAYINKAYQTRKEKSGVFSSFTNYPVLLLGILHNEKGEYELSNKFYRQCIQVNDSLYGPDNRWSANVYGNMGLNYTSLNMLDSAIFCNQKAIEDNISVLGIDNYELVYPLLNMGELYEIQEDYDLAESYYLETIRLCEKIYGPKYRMSIEALNLLANLNIKKGEYQKAQFYANQALAGCQYQPTSDVPFAPINYPQIFIKALLHRAKTTELDTSSLAIQERLNLALDDIEVATNYIEHVRTKFHEDGSKQILAKASLSIYEKGISLCSQLLTINNDPILLDKVLGFFEQTKGLSILEALQESDAFEYTDVPKHFIDSLREIQVLKNNIEAELHQNTDLSAQNELEYKSIITTLTIQYNQLLNQLESQYPDYYRMKYVIPQPNISELQSQLKNSEATTISYFLGKKNIFSILINQDTVILHSQPIDSLFSYISQLRKLLDHPTSEISKIKTLGKLLYTLLIGPHDHFISSDLTIVTDSYLGYIPFEVLIDPNLTYNEESSYNWFIQNHRIQYAHSLALFNRPHSGIKQKAHVISFAPHFPNSLTESTRTVLSSLQYNELEATEIAQITHGKAMVHNQANKTNFLKIQADADVIHLATHAIINDRIGEQSFIAFGQSKNSRLNVQEIYQVPIAAQLVVLSACETGVGELRKGEGIISIARAFTYAGAKSLVTSLWPVNDKTTSQIMTTFYQELKNGHKKHYALALAKKEYLNNVKSPLEAHPFYWAPFITMGDNSPIKFKRSFPLYNWIFIGFILYISIYWIKSRKSKSALT